jgi:hypothetical protein
LQRLLEQQHQEVVATGQQVERRVGSDRPEALGRPSGPLAVGTLACHLDVAAGRQTLEVVARHVRMDGEPGRHLGGRRPRIGPDEQVDLPTRRVAEGGGDGGDGGGELAVGVGAGLHHGAVRVGLHVP